MRIESRQQHIRECSVADVVPDRWIEPLLGSCVANELDTQEQTPSAGVANHVAMLHVLWARPQLLAHRPPIRRQVALQDLVDRCQACGPRDRIAFKGKPAMNPGIFVASPQDLSAMCVSTKGGRLVTHAKSYWWLFVERHLKRKLFGEMLNRRGTACAEGCTAKGGRNRTEGLPERRARRELSAALGGPNRKLGIMGPAPPPPRTSNGGIRRWTWRPPRVSGFRRTDR